MQVGEKRTVLDTGGKKQFLESEHYYNELLTQMKLTAGYDATAIDKYELLDNAYRAKGGFETGDYLIPHPSELATKYDRRKKLSYFLNYVKPVVDSLVNPIFKTLPTRDNKSNTYELFENDVDGAGTGLNTFMKRVAIRAKLHGVEFIVVDMERLEDGSVLTQKDRIENRVYPYLYSLSPANVDKWFLDKLGRLVSITYHIEDNVLQKDGTVKRVRENWTWTKETCIRRVEDKEEVFENPIGIIPIIPVYGTRNDSYELIPQSDMYAVARANFALYNACSELRERNRNQGFSILTYPLDEEDEYDTAESPLQIGTADTLIYKNGSQAPQFITPPPDSSNIIENEIKFIIQEIHRMARLRILDNDKGEYNISGLSRRWENLQLFQSISEFAQELKDAEEKLAIVFGKYMGEDNSNIQISYNSEFGIPDPATDLANAVTALQMNISPLFNEEVKKKVIKALLDGEDGAVLENIIKDFDSEPTKGNPVTLEQVSVVQPVG